MRYRNHCEDIKDENNKSTYDHFFLNGCRLYEVSMDVLKSVSLLKSDWIKKQDEEKDKKLLKNESENNFSKL